MLKIFVQNSLFSSLDELLSIRVLLGGSSVRLIPLLDPPTRQIPLLFIGITVKLAAQLSEMTRFWSSPDFWRSITASKKTKKNASVH